MIQNVLRSFHFQKNLNTSINRSELNFSEAWQWLRFQMYHFFFFCEIIISPFLTNSRQTKPLQVFHRHISLDPNDTESPTEARFATNGERYKAAEMVDFNSLYVSFNFIYMRYIDFFEKNESFYDCRKNHRLLKWTQLVFYSCRKNHRLLKWTQLVFYSYRKNHRLLKWTQLVSNNCRKKHR